MATSLCPSCRTLIRLPDEKLHSRVRCPQCREPFTAEAVHGSPHAVRSSPWRPPPRTRRFRLLHLVLLLASVGGLAALWYALDPAAAGRAARAAADPPPGAAARTARPAPAQADPRDHPAFRRIAFLVRALETFNAGSVEGQLDLPSWYAAEADPAAPLWTALPRRDRQAFATALVERLMSDAALRDLTAHPPTAAFFKEQSGQRLVFEARSEEVPERIWLFTLVLREGLWRLAAYDTRVDAGIGAGEEEDLPAQEEDDAEVFVQIGEGEGRIYKGEVGRVERIEGTTAEETARIEQLLEQYLGDDTLARRRARDELRELGPKPVPFLLNRVADLPLTEDPGRIDALGRLNEALTSLSWRRSAWPVPGMTAMSDEDEIQQRRKLSIEGWFGWWALWGHRWDAWKKEAGIPEPDPRRRRRR